MKRLALLLCIILIRKVFSFSADLISRIKNKEPLLDLDRVTAAETAAIALQYMPVLMICLTGYLRIDRITIAGLLPMLCVFSGLCVYLWYAVKSWRCDVPYDWMGICYGKTLRQLGVQFILCGFFIWLSRH